MVLHLVPDGFDSIELEEIRLFLDDPQPKTPMMHEWTSDNKEQTIIHQATGCRFRAIRLQSPLVNGLTLPFEHTYEIAAKFAGMRDNAPRPVPDRIRQLGQEGLVWILTYTFESSRRRA
jgi:hypothetical protein